MKLTKEILLEQRRAAEQQRDSHLANANLAAGRIVQIDEQLVLLSLPEPKKK